MAFTYSVIDSFSIVFLMILFFNTREHSTGLTEARCFRAIVLMTSAALACDMVAWQLDGIIGVFPRHMLWAANIFCYILSGTMTLSWLYYTALKMNRVSRIPNLAWILISIPCVILIALSLISPWTHGLFYLDSNNTYQRGALFFAQMIIPFGYILAAALWAIHQASNERLRQQRMEYFSLASFIIFPIIGGILQLAIYGISIAWPCSALSLMLVYVSMQNQKISLDALTGLNNRGQFDKHIYGCIEHAENDFPFALLMLDIDDFKKINDEFGHIAGDVALIDTANILKKALERTNSFLARYGGDEFAIVLKYTNDEQISALLSKISEELQNHNNLGTTSYKLIFSIGYVCFDKHRYSNYQDMITAADAQMYIQKRQHKLNRI